MHQHVAHPPGPEQSQGVIDNLSDTLLNAFARVRKPDERFLVMRENVDKFEESLSTSERLWNRIRSRTTGKSLPQLSANSRSEAERAGTPDSPGEDLTADYHDLAVGVQGLGFLESGITDQLNHFSNTLLEFSALLRHTVRFLEIFGENQDLTRLQTQNTMDPFLVHLHSLLAYSHAHRAVLKLRDQKQLDLEELTEYLSGVTAERDRLSAIISGHAGSSGLGLSGYLRDKMDAIRGADDDRSRVEKMKKLDAKIKEVSITLVTTAPR
jgi:sorting nexin-4